MKSRKELRNIRDYIAEDNEKYAAKTIKEIYGKFENLQMFPGMGSNLSMRVFARCRGSFYWHKWHCGRT
jgi:toxin ParE1/3/4